MLQKLNQKIDKKTCAVLLKYLQDKIYKELLDKNHIDLPAVFDPFGKTSTELMTDPETLKHLCEELLREIGSKVTIKI